MNKNGFSLPSVILGILIACLIGGGYYFYNQKSLSPKTPQVTNTTANNTVADETANWEVFRNNEMGFEIKHPSDFKVDDLDGVVVVYTGEKRVISPDSPLDPYPTGITIYNRSNPTFKNAIESCEAELCNNFLDFSKSPKGIPDPNTPYRKENVKINNASGLKITSTGNTDLADYYLSSDNGNNIVRISLEPTETILKILSTFKFLDNQQDKTAQVLPEPTEIVSDNSRRIDYQPAEGWKSYTSQTGYSITHASFDIGRSEQMDNGGCSLVLTNNVGGQLVATVLPYNGGSRRELLFSYYPNLRTSYTYQYEEVLIQNRKALLIEIGPTGESGSGTAVVIPDGKNALIVMRDHVSKNSPEMVKILQGIKINQTLNLSSCSL